MSETNYSPEPWRVVTETSDEGWPYTAVWGHDELPVVDDHGVTSKATARRIIACVNACAGIPTEALESGALAKALEAASLVASYAAECVPEVDQDELRTALRRLGKLP